METFGPILFDGLPCSLRKHVENMIGIVLNNHQIYSNHILNA